METAVVKAEVVQDLSTERYDALVDEINTLVGEKTWEIRHDQIKMKWSIGDLIVMEFREAGVKYHTEIIARIGKDTNISPSELYRCIRAKEKWDTWELLMAEVPEGKNISWNKIRQNYLPDLPMAKLQMQFPQVEMIDKFHLISWWDKQESKNITLLLKDPKSKTVLRVSMTQQKNNDLKTPLQNALTIIREHLVKAKGWNEKDLDQRDYARIHASIKRLLLKSKGDIEKIKCAIDWVKKQDYPDWSLETVEKKYADASKPVDPYEKYRVKESKWNRK